MEESIFPDPAVAGIMKQHYVEARLHTDYPHLLELEKQMAQSISQPVYLIIDPNTGNEIARREGAWLSASRFVQFFENALRS